MNQVAFTAPHYKAAQIGLDLLKDGCNAVDAMVAAAAAITVVYPHMNSIGGDGFWLIQKPGEVPLAIDASGFSASKASIKNYLSRQLTSIPSRGADACITLAGTISGWQVARNSMEQVLGYKSRSLSELLTPAKQLAIDGIEVTESLEAASRKCLSEISVLEADTIVSTDPMFAPYISAFSHDNKPLLAGTKLKNPALAGVFEQMIHAGLDDFYRGDLAIKIAKGLEDAGSPITLEDINDYSAKVVNPLSVKLSCGELYNMPPPTQGLASLIILALYDQLQKEGFSEAEHIHYLIEATKEAFKIRDKVVGDPNRITTPVESYLTSDNIKSLVANIGKQAQPWPYKAEPGDTVWMGCTDQNGVMVSFIQSVYWEFGSAIVIPDTGIVWNNRGSSFSLDVQHHNALGARVKPFHTLNPAFAQLKDGRRVVYGTMGGEGQPQTQAALFARKFYQNMSLQDAVSRGRWLLGRTWGDQNSDLKMEQDIYDELGEQLEKRGHKISVVTAKNELMGHAGAIIESGGELESVCDPRSDGAGLVAL